jgi:uncharacterized membrane-anchored protein
VDFFDKNIRPILARIIAPFIAVAAAWLLGHVPGLPPTLAADLQNVVLNVAGAVLLALYGVGHKTLNKYIHPDDTAAG